MIKVEKIDVWGFEHAIRGMRNPMNSWNKSDSKYVWDENDGRWDACEWVETNLEVGQNDLDLMKRLYKSGTEHRTYARMIQVSMDITAPLYWWKEMDRYTIGKSQVSCSTMHKIAAKEFELDDFSHEHMKQSTVNLLKEICEELNGWRYIYLNGSGWCGKHDKEVWWQLIQLLPSSYNQKRTVCMSYETVFKIIRERTGHKLDEWREFVEILRRLPYVAEITGE